MMAYIMFVVIYNNGGSGSGLASFQQAFKTNIACQKSLETMKRKFSSYSSVDGYCQEVRQ